MFSRAHRLFTHPSTTRIIVATRNRVFKSPYPYIQPLRISLSEQLLKRLWLHGCENPTKAAIINAFNPADQLTFKELYLRSLSVATFLRQNDFHHGNVVALVLPNLVDYPAIVFGTGLVGGASTPASVYFGAKELETQFIDSKTSMVFCADFMLDKVLEAIKNCPKIKKVICLKSGLLPDGSPEIKLPKGVIDYERKIKDLQPEIHWNDVECNHERDIYYLPYSSGTTGPPKGVMISNRNLSVMLPNFANFFKKSIFPYINKENPITINDRHLIFLPFFHIFGIGTILTNLYLGISTIIMPKFDFEQLCKNIQEHKIRIMFCVPPILQLLANHKAVDKYDISSLEYILAGAAPVSKDLMEDVQKRLTSMKGLQQGFGMTEAAMVTHCNTTKEKYPYNSVGKLMPGFEMKIIDPDTQKELDVNETGEVCLKSPQIMIGYFNKPQSTAMMKDDEGWLRTGDIGFVDDEGYTYIVDRMKELIKVKGLQVAPAELEALLLTHPKIKDAAVIGIPDVHNGEVPKAFVVADGNVTEDEVKDFVAGSLATYKHLKGGVQFINEIPKSPSGKILRRLLRDQRKS